MAADHCQSILRMDILNQWKDIDVGDVSIAKRALACVVPALKVCGSVGICTTVSRAHLVAVDTYRTLGFSELSVDAQSPTTAFLTLGRPI